ncbi:MAG: hypothetical protein DK302_000936 [Chloroflexi bacterium]|jgi:hypothetical protein|nr:MAG: hypothetical protein DK302_000936 [Chloroflexota bacterium]
MAKKGKKVASKQAGMKARKKNRDVSTRLTEAQTSSPFISEKETKSTDNNQSVNESHKVPITRSPKLEVQPKTSGVIQSVAFSHLRVELLHITCITVVLAAVLAALTIVLN